MMPKELQTSAGMPDIVSHLGRHDRICDCAKIRSFAHRWEHRCCPFSERKEEPQATLTEPSSVTRQTWCSQCHCLFQNLRHWPRARRSVCCKLVTARDNCVRPRLSLSKSEALARARRSVCCKLVTARDNCVRPRLSLSKSEALARARRSVCCKLVTARDNCVRPRLSLSKSEALARARRSVVALVTKSEDIGTVFGLVCLFQNLRHWPVLDGPSVALSEAEGTTVSALVCLFQHLRHWPVPDGPLLHSLQKGQLCRPRLSLSKSEALAPARRSVVALVTKGTTVSASSVSFKI